MEPLIEDPFLVPVIFHWAVTVLCLVLCFRYSSSDNCSKLMRQVSLLPAIGLCIFFILLLGVRGSRYFGDSYSYRHTYDNFISDIYPNIDWNKEWFFVVIQTWCKSMGMNYVEYFLTIEIGYIGLMFLAFKKLLWENVWFAMLFAFSAFSFMSYGVNGLRNGLACSIVLLAMAFMANGKVKNLPVGIGLCVLVLGVHRSTILSITKNV